ncbi:MAG TPA: hypothetical protein PKZ26_00675 [Anaerolineaceae bacterium]|jgi:hypothetical protein|nr:hypothetical protein [Anaerolineaceae bacterium]NMC18561.1 hypothetical protein [Chloroflexota bacterium]HOE02441.1 hypothetical protein [Anaerolineaceae bacterium]HPD62645.1 hypothetical protein [Anaerolineaceae bacterium]HQK04605.1 hypothetical protein [Anaerolineaceae bacterium]
MPKHDMYHSEMPPKPTKLPAHPIWRGVGCILIVVLPLISYYLTSFLIDNKEKYPWLVIPEDLIIKQYMKDPLIIVRLVYALVFLIALVAFLSLLVSIVLRLFLPSKYEPVDVPPEKIYKP